ncbi:head completion adaptor [Vibrio phage 1.177.O._10N.286.45.E10]|nr:head completion adaptor [Vibrio phage 1.177.O._10N.286.45.E10]
MIVQDPLTPTADADSMVSVADARLRAVNLGVPLPADDTECEVALVKGNVYLNGLCFYGEPVVGFQGTSWPRKNVVINNNEYPDDQIPQQAIDAQVVSAAYAATGDIYTVVDNDKRVKRKKIDVIETEYFGTESGSSTGKKTITRAEELLAMFTCDGTFGGEVNWAYLG